VSEWVAAADVASATNDPTREPLISLNLQGMTLENALKILTEKIGLNFVMSSDLSVMKVDVYLRDVPPEAAFFTLLKANGLWYEKQRGTNIYIVSKLEGVPTDKLVTEIVGCEYARVADMGNIIAENLSGDGTFVVDQRTNSVILSDVPESVARLKRILAELDRPSKQVLIEVKIVEINLTAGSELGVSWDWTGTAGEGSHVGAATLGHSFSTIAEGLLSLSIGRYASDDGVRNLQTSITALVQEGSADLLASPRILTLDGKPASIMITEHIVVAQKTVYQATGGESRSVEPIFGDVGVMLTVTPHVLNERFTILDVKPSVSSALKSTLLPGEAVDTQERTAETSVMVEDGQTIVIGGLFRKNKKTSISKVPLLGDIPILGHLFRKKITDTVKTEITVFLTPHIITVENP
jgi:type IV pilus assembly protein PilQ